MGTESLVLATKDCSNVSMSTLQMLPGSVKEENLYRNSEESCFP
jgi:hypothetical protein